MCNVFRFLIGSILCLVTGCQYDGSTLQMNSDSPSPFLGLQWSVRADRPQKLESAEQISLARADYSGSRSESTTEMHDEQSPDWMSASAGANSLSGASTHLVHTSDQTKRTGRVRYSLDRMPPAKQNLADETSLRLRGF